MLGRRRLRLSFDDDDDGAELLFARDDDDDGGDAHPDRSGAGPSPRRSCAARREGDDNGEDGEDVGGYGDHPKNDGAVAGGTRSSPSSPDASTFPSSSSPSAGPPPRQIRRRPPQQQPGGGTDIDIIDAGIIGKSSSRPKNPRMQTFAYLNRPVVEVRIIGIVLLSCFLQAIDTLAGLPYEVHRGIGVVDTVCVYVFAIEFFLRWWSAGRFQLRYLSKPLVSIDAVRE